MKTKKAGSRFLACTLAFLLCFGSSFSCALAEGIERTLEVRQEEAAVMDGVFTEELGLSEPPQENPEENIDSEDAEFLQDSEGAESPQDEESLNDSDMDLTVAYDPQPMTMEDVQEAIDAYEDKYLAALETEGFLAALEVQKPRWQYEVAAGLMPQGWHCELVDWDEGFGLIYWTFFPSPVSMEDVNSITDIADLQTAIDDADSGDTILLDAGLDGETLLAVLTIHDKSLTFKAESGAVTLYAAAGARHMTVSGDDVTLSFENVILDGGYVPGDMPYTGGLASAAATLELVNVQIQDCYANQGGGIYIQGGCTVIISGSDTRIRSNTANSGGGVYLANGQFTMNNGSIIGNTAYNYGGGVYVYSSGSMVMKDGDISYNKVEAAGNTATGGGIYGGNITIEGGAIHHNDVGTSPNGSRGGGIAVFRTSTLKIYGGEIYENKATWGGGIFLDAYSPASGNPHSVITGDAKIYQNYACYGGGITVYNNATFAPMETEISGNVKITDNVASTEYGRATDTSAIGGGVFYYSNLGSTTCPEYHLINATISGEVEISGNTAGTYGGGIAIRGSAATNNTTVTAVYSALTITDDVAVCGNQAPTAAGILVWNSDLLLIGRVLVSANEATGDAGGGGIRHSAGAYDTVRLTDQVRIIGNKAEKGNGGGIYANIRSRVFVDEEVVFADNVAVMGYAWKLDRDATPGDGSASGVHMSNILTTSFTVPFTNAYNNFDIGYVMPFYTVTFYDDDETLLASFAVDEVDGTTVYASYPAGLADVEKPDNPTKMAAEGYKYEFEQWNPQGDYSIDDASRPITQNMAFIASYLEIQTYTLTVEAGIGGTVNETVNGSYAEGEVITIAATANSGYTFKQWTSDVGGSFENASDAATTFTMPAGDVTLTASYEIQTYALTVQAGIGGSVDDNVNGSYTEGEVITITATANSGYTFKQWISDVGGSFENASDATTTFTMPAGDVTLTASYEIQTYSLTVQAGISGSVDTTVNGCYAAGTEIAITAAAGSGYKFKGWSSDNGGTFANASSASTKFTMPAGNVTITANFTSDRGSSSSGGGGTTTYSVTYKANGGTGSDHKVTGIKSGSKHTVLSATIAGFSRTDYTFSGWNTKANGSGMAYTVGDSITVSGNVTLYAQWSAVQSSDDTEAHAAYLNGYSDGTVKPDNAITRAEVAAILYRLLDTSATAAGGWFSDVSNSAWYANAVNYLASIGVVNGYSDGTFKPDTPITRAELVAIVSRFAGLGYGGSSSFSDVSSSHWASDYISAASTKGWINGYSDGTFRPDINITRAEVVMVVNAMLGRKIYSTALVEVINPYSDINKNHWAYVDIIEASVEHKYTRDGSSIEIWQIW